MKKKRDLRIETDKAFAKSLLHNVYSRLNRHNKVLLLEATFAEDSVEPVPRGTNYYRELAYNLEHTIHHLALITVGINDVSNIILPAGYGVASSTIKFKNACVQ